MSSFLDKKNMFQTTKSFHIKLHWFTFIVISSLYILAMNITFFEYLYTNLDEQENPLLAISLPILYVSLIIATFSLCFLPYLTKPLMILLCLAASCSSYFMQAYGVIIDKDMLENAIRTDQKEFFELLNFKMIFFIVLTGVLPCLFVLKTEIIYGTFKRHMFIKFTTCVSALVVFAVLLLLLSKSLFPFIRSHNKVRVYNTPFYQIYSAVRLIKAKTIPKPEFKIIASDAYLPQSTDKNLLIFVIGETARAANFSLGSYTKNDTNPYTKAEDVIYFDNVSSCGTSTAKSVPCLLSISRRREHWGNEYQENILDILQKVGVRVSWFGNNSGGCQEQCDRLKIVRKISKPFDEELLPQVAEELKEDYDNKLIVVHLQGSHGPTYYKRYPDSFKKFTPTCDTNELQQCSSDEIVNTYDNTLLYTDFILQQLINMLKDMKDYNVSLLYVSDHGESLGENGIYLHGMPYGIAPDVQTHVPMIFWSQQTDLGQIAQHHKAYKLSHDYIFNTLLGYFNIQTSLYNSQMDILSEDLKEDE